MERIRRPQGVSRPGHDHGGFTLIELLVVILIVAILAAVAIPVFLRQRQKGYEDQIRSDLKNAALAVETYAVEPGSNGSYVGLDGLTGTDLDPQGFNMPAYLLYLRIQANAGEYCIEARHGSLTSASAWRRSTYQSSRGEPQPTPDNCPNL